MLLKVFTILSHKGNANLNCHEIHFIQVRMAKIKKIDNKLRRKCGEQETLTLLFEMKISEATIKISGVVPKKIKFTV